MADFDRIKTNVSKMIDGGAHETEIDEYLGSEGVNADQLRDATKTTTQRLADSWGGDIAQSAASGLTRGVAGLVGLPGEISRGVRWAASKTGIAPNDQDYIEGRGKYALSADVATPTANSLMETARPILGEEYQPKTTAGKYARTVGEFLPGALAGPGKIAQNALLYAAIPGVASEAAGQVTAGTAIEPYARFAGAVGGLGASALLRRPGSAGEVVAESLRGVDKATINRAGQLVDDAASRGITLTWPEAIQQVTNSGTPLSNLQRVVEASQEGGAVMRPVMAQRPAQVRKAFEDQVAQVAAVPMRPYMIGPEIAQASEEAIDATRRNINRIAKPFYDKASTVKVPPARLAQMKALPGWDEALSAVRSNPQLNRYIANLPDDSVGVLNEVKKYLDQQSRNVASVTNPNRNVQQSAGYGLDAEAVRTAGRKTTGQYGKALDTEEQLRRNMLEPMQHGPLGRAADAGTTEGVISKLLPQNPLPNTAAETGRAFKELMTRNPRAAANVIRTRMEQSYNQAARDLSAGGHEWGGAMTRKALVGDRQLRRNLRAAMQELPNGQAVSRGFERLMEVFQATGRRQHIGSQTEFNRLIAERLKQGGIPGEMLSGATNMNPLSMIRSRYQQWQLGRNLGEIAELIVDPNARNKLIELAGLNQASPRGMVISAELVSQLLSDANDAPGAAVVKP